MTKIVLWAGLAVGCIAGLAAFMYGVNLPLSIACGFAAASVVNLFATVVL